jgi:hypothetical protein
VVVSNTKQYTVKAQTVQKYQTGTVELSPNQEQVNHVIHKNVSHINGMHQALVAVINHVVVVNNTNQYIVNHQQAQKYQMVIVRVNQDLQQANHVTLKHVSRIIGMHQALVSVISHAAVVSNIKQYIVKDQTELKYQIGTVELSQNQAQVSHVILKYV